MKKEMSQKDTWENQIVSDGRRKLEYLLLGCHCQLSNKKMYLVGSRDFFLGLVLSDVLISN